MKAREDRLLSCLCVSVGVSWLSLLQIWDTWEKKKSRVTNHCAVPCGPHMLCPLHQSVFSCLVPIEGPGSLGVLCENDRDRYVTSLCPETGRSFILRLKSETLLSKDTALTILKKLHQVATKLYIKWISNPYQVVWRNTLKCAMHLTPKENQVTKNMF